MAMKPTAEPLNRLIQEVTSSTADRDHAILLLGETLKSVILKHVPEADQEAAGKMIEAELERIKSGDLRVASGFFGNWAKRNAELK